MYVCVVRLFGLIEPEDRAHPIGSIWLMLVVVDSRPLNMGSFVVTRVLPVDLLHAVSCTYGCIHSRGVFSSNIFRNGRAVGSVLLAGANYCSILNSLQADLAG